MASVSYADIPRTSYTHLRFNRLYIVATILKVFLPSEFNPIKSINEKEDIHFQMALTTLAQAIARGGSSASSSSRLSLYHHDMVEGLNGTYYFGPSDRKGRLISVEFLAFVLTLW